MHVAFLITLGCYQDWQIHKTVEGVTEVVEYRTAGEFSIVQGEAQAQRLDVLIVVDESGSMVREQQNLATNLTGWWADLTGPDFDDLDWRVAITSTDPASGIYEWVSYDDPQAQLRLSTLTTLLGSHPIEAGLDAAAASIAWDVDFHRPDAHLLVIWLSDEDSQGTYSGYDWRALAASAKAFPYTVRAVAIVYAEGDPTSASCDYADDGRQYIRAADHVLSICEPSTWAQAMDAARTQVPNLSTVWPLSAVPAWPYRAHLWVWVDGVHTEGYVYDRGSNVVTLDDAPTPGAWVVVAVESEVLP